MAILNQPKINKLRFGDIIAACILLSCIVGVAAFIGADSRMQPASQMDGIDSSTGLPPTVSDTPGQGIIAGQSGVSFIWTITGTASAASYHIYKNGTNIASGIWTDGNPVNCSLDNLGPGIYNFTIVAFNTWGNDSDTVIVTASPSPSPVITSPGNGSFVVGGQISWIATDAGTNMTTFTVYRNGTVVATGVWTSGVAITISLSGLLPGMYNFTLVVNDGLGGIAQDEITATVAPAPVDGVVWGVVIAFGCACAFIVFKAVKIVTLSPKKSIRT